MTRPVYSFRPNLKNPEHQRAWEKFQSVPEGESEPEEETEPEGETDPEESKAEEPTEW